MVVLNGNGPSYQPLSVTSKKNNLTKPSKTLSGTMEQPVTKGKLPNMDKVSGGQKKSEPLTTGGTQKIDTVTTIKSVNVPTSRSTNEENSSNTTTTATTTAIVPKRKKGRPSKSAVTLKASAKVKDAAAKSAKPMQSKVLLDTVIPFITCNLCKGYLIDATTIVECLHTFCHSCIMIHLRQKQYCPCCELMINKSKPNIKPDTIRQAIVYKLVPGLYEKEILRRQDFYRAHPDEAKLATPEQRGEDTENLIFSPSENISLSVEYADAEDAADLDGVWKSPKYLQCPASFTVNMLSKFIMMKIGMDSNKFLVDISYKVKTIVLADYYTLMDVAYIYTWKREAPMRFYFSVRTKSTTNEELPEVPFRRSPGIAPNALPPLLVNGIAIGSSDVQGNNATTAASDNKQGQIVPVLHPLVETKLKLVKKVNDSPRVSDKKRVVYMVQNSAQSDNEPQISAAAAYALLPHEVPSAATVGVNSTLTAQSQLSNGSASSVKQQQQQQQRTAEEGTPRYRSLVEKENAKMKKLMQSLSEEKKLLKMRKREAMKEAAAASAAATNVTPPNEKKCETLKLKITKNDSGGMMVIQNNSVDQQQPKDVLSIIDSVAKCDTNDNYRKSLFLNAFELRPKQSIPDKSQKPVKISTKSQNHCEKTAEMKKSISFGFSSYEFEKSKEKDKLTATKSVESVKQKSPSNLPPPPPPPSEKAVKKPVMSLKRTPSEEKLSAGQNLQQKKLSSYVKIAPKELQQIRPKSVANSPNVEQQSVATAKPVPNKNIKVVATTVNIPVMAPPPVPQPPPRAAPSNGSIYAFLHSNPSPKQLFKPMGNMSGFSQFQTMPSPVYMTNANAGSTPIYSPNSPQYAPNFSLPQHQQFKYTKFPTYMTNFTLPSVQVATSSAAQPPPPPQRPAVPTSSITGVGKATGKVSELAKPPPMKEQKVLTSSAANISSKGVGYLNTLPPPPIFSPSSGMSITTTTTMAPLPVPPLVVLPKRSPEAEVNAAKRKNPSSASPVTFDSIPTSKPQSPVVAREDPPEKQRKVQSLLDSCNITFPSSLSITIANENETGDKSGPHNGKLKSPVNNYIEILKIPSSDSANCAPEQNNKFPVSAASVLQQQPHSKPQMNNSQQQQIPPLTTTAKPPNNPSTFAAAAVSSHSVTTTNVLRPSTTTPPTTTTAAPLMKLGSAGSMSITPAITSNIMQLINAKGPKDSSVSMTQQSPADLKRKSPPIEVTAIKRPTPSPPKSTTLGVTASAAQTAQPPPKQVTSTTSGGDSANKQAKNVPKLMPKLNPIEKVPIVKQPQQPQPAPQQMSVKQPAKSPVNNVGGAASAAVSAATAAAIAKETFQREFLKFANDKEGENGVAKVVQQSTTKSVTSKDAPMKTPANANKATTTPQDGNSKAQQRKSPVKIKPKSSGGVQQEKKQSVANNKPQMPEPTAIAPFPLHNHLQQQQHQQQQQQQQSQEYAAALMKMAIEFQHQQKLAALQQSQYPSVLGDLMMSNPVAMFNNPVAAAAAAAVVPQQQQQINSLIQQACLMEHFERMKRAGKEALERYAHNIQQEQNLVAQQAQQKEQARKSPVNMGAGKGQVQRPKQKGKTASLPVLSTKQQSKEPSPPKSDSGNKTNSTEGSVPKTAKSPKPLQTSNHQASVKQDDPKKDIKP